MKDFHFIDQFRMFNRFYAKLLSKFDNKFYSTNFSLNEARIVAEIYDHYSLNAKELVTNLYINKGQLSTIIKKLEKDEIIQRSIDPEDKRAFTISLTKKGKDLHLNQVKKVREGLWNEIADYSINEKKRLANAMTLFQETYTKNYFCEITEGTLDDGLLIATLYEQIARSQKRAIRLEDFLSSLASFIEVKKDNRLWLAKVNNKTVGCIGLKKENEHVGEICWLFVAPEYQGMHLGLALLKTVINYASTNQIYSLELSVENQQQAARNLFIKQGFSLIEAITTEQQSKTIIEKWRWHLS